MTVAGRLVPDGPLARTRLVAIVVIVIGLLTELPQLGNPLHTAAFIRLSAGAIVVLLAVLVYTYVCGRSAWWTVPLAPALAALGSAGLKDPVAGVSISIAGLVLFSLYGSTRMLVARVVATLIAIPAGVALSPQSANRPMPWNSPTVLGLLPQVIFMAILMRAIYLAMYRTERSAQVDAVLTRVGLTMIGMTDVDEVHVVGEQAAADLAAILPGVALLVVRQTRGGLRITALAGAPEELRGRAVPRELITEPGGLVQLMPGYRYWQISTLGADPAVADAMIAVGGRRPVRTDELNAFRATSHQVVLAEQSCRAHAELDHLAHHDHLTQLPTRAKFFRTLHQSLAGTPAGTVALLNVDLDRFKQVNDRYGHAAGDELLVEVGARLSAAATAGHGLAARFGGDEFAVLLTGLTGGTGEARAIAETLAARLAEPIELTGATVTVGASIGVAVAEPGITSAELTRRADLAMYTVKVAGKRRTDMAEARGRTADRMPV